MRLITSLAVLSLFACSSADAPSVPPQASRANEIPITSKSPQAVDHFRKGRELADNLRQAEATAEFNEALKLDPEFALALMYRGNATPGPGGLADIEQAKAKAATASKPEQILIDATLASRRNELARSQQLWGELAEAVPDDWRVHMGRGSQLYSAEKYDEAITSLTRATALNPSAGPAYNMIGYAHLVQGETEPAIEALKKYAALNPNEPNPHDSLGEALMAAGRMTEAEASFRKAAAMGEFPIAWEGVAYTKFFSRDWNGGRQALAEARKGSSRATDRVNIDRLGLAATFAEGRAGDGLKQLDAFVSSADVVPGDVAFADIFRGMVLIDSGRYADAAARGEKAVENSASGKFSPFLTMNLERAGWMVQAAAAGFSNDPGRAQKAVDALQAAAAKRPDNPQLASTVHFAQGMAAAASKDIKNASAHFERCSDSDIYCHWQAAAIRQKAGDTAGAEASRARLTRLHRRDPIYLLAWSRTGTTAKVSD